MNDYAWLEKKTPRSVDQLRLWAENPRLNPTETHLYLSDFVEDLIVEDSEKKHFFRLIISITDDGFIPADPIVIWKNLDNEKYYVAEGNRRVAALKLLRNPEKAPKSIRSFIRIQSQKIPIESIEKILVNVAPSFEEAEWYINQRNSASSLQRPWTRIQQQRWILSLYDKYNGNIDIISSKTKMSKSDLNSYLRAIRLLDLLKEAKKKDLISQEDYNNGTHYKFPVTVLERFFNSSDVTSAWGISFNDNGIILTKNRTSFLRAFVELVRRIIDKDATPKIDTRTITTHLNEILESLPKVENMAENEAEQSTHDDTEEENTPPQQTPPPATSPIQQNPPKPAPALKNNPNRNRLIIGCYFLKTDSSRLLNLFQELKQIPLKYNNSIAASIRIFLDLSVLNYLRAENLDTTLQAEQQTRLNRIQLNTRLEFLKQNGSLQKESKKIIDKLLKPDNDYSLDSLNGYVHSDKTYYLNKQFLNGFWDFLFPFLENILDIEEKK